MRRVRTTQVAVAIVLAAVLQGCGSDEDPPPTTVCGLKGALVASVLGTNDISEDRSGDGALSTAVETGYYTCNVETDSYENAEVTASLEPVPSDVSGKMTEMPVRYSYEQGDAALKITPGGAGDGGVSGLDARWLCGRLSVRVNASTHKTILQKDARNLLENAADEAGCDPV